MNKPKIIFHCKDCGYCKSRGWQQTNRYNKGKERKHYYCTYPNVEEIVDFYNMNRAVGFISFGIPTPASPIAIKTTPRWCPRKVEKK